MPRLQASPPEIQKYLALLEETPRLITTCIGGANEDTLRKSPGKRDWSPVEVLAHLRACDDLWSHSIYAMLAEDNPTLPLLDERRWARSRRYADLSFYTSFQAFTLSRGELLYVLRVLPHEAWSRTATIKGRTHSVFSQARRLALHESEHCEQLKTLIEH